MNSYAHAPTHGPDQAALAEARPTAPSAGRGRLIAWLVVVAVLASLSFAGKAIVSHDTSPPSSPIYYSNQTPDGGTAYGFAPPAETRDDSAYRWAFGIAGLVQYGIILGVVLLIARGLPRRETFALRRPRSWPRTLGLVAGVLVATYVLLALVASALGDGAETDQGIPVFWDGSRAAQFALTFLVVAVVAPIVEELMFRGLGYGLLFARFGPAAALGGTAVLFGLMHGFLVALPLFVIVGLAFGWLRMRTGSVYPGMVAHGVFNAAVTIVAVSVGP